MQAQKVTISLPAETAEKLRSQVPDRSRSKFIAKAIEGKLEAQSTLKDRFTRSLKANQILYSQEQKDWE